MLKTTSNVVSRLSDSLSECTYASVPRNVHVVAPLLMVTLGSQFLFLHVVVGRIWAWFTAQWLARDVDYAVVIEPWLDLYSNSTTGSNICMQMTLVQGNINRSRIVWHSDDHYWFLRPTKSFYIVAPHGMHLGQINNNNNKSTSHNRSPFSIGGFIGEGLLKIK